MRHASVALFVVTASLLFAPASLAAQTRDDAGGVLSVAEFFAKPSEERVEIISRKVTSTIEYYLSPTYLSGPNEGDRKTEQVRESHRVLGNFVTDLYFGDGYETDHVFEDPAERLIVRLRAVERNSPDGSFDRAFATVLNMEWQDYQRLKGG